MTRPVIGLTMSYGGERPSYSLPGDYVDSVIVAGGLPLVLPPAEDVALVEPFLDRLDGLIFTGGPDVDPADYRQEPHPKTQPLHPRRNRFELALARAAVRRALPTMGICLGCQMLNVALGGTLYQHIPDDLPGSLTHSDDRPGSRFFHGVRVEPDSRLAGILGTTSLETNSHHHQAIRKPAPGLRPVAWAEDGVIEAAEGPLPAFLLAIQWHPENLAAERAIHRALFVALMEAAGAVRADAGR